MPVSLEIQAFAEGFPDTLLHAGVTFLILAVGALLYVWLTPYRELKLIRAGNTAAAVSLGAILVGLAIPLAVSMAVSRSLLDIALWGVATTAVQLLVFRLTDLVLRGLPRRIAEGEMAAATLLAGAKLATAVILGAAVTG